MNKVYWTLLLFIFSVSIVAQIGILTENPLQVLHIDGMGDNTNPVTDIQQENDVVVTSEGNVGIATINPDRKLTVNGKIQIKDGSQANGKILMSDANGLASWNGNVSVKGKYGSWRLSNRDFLESNGTITSHDAGTSGAVNFTFQNTGQVQLTAPFQNTTYPYTGSFILPGDAIGLTAISNGVHIPQGNYFVVLNGDIVGKSELCTLYIYVGNTLYWHVSYAEFLSGVIFLLLVNTPTGVNLSLNWENRPTNVYYWPNTTANTAQYRYTLDFNLLGNLLFN
ncbi:hypothetical protein [Dysgonomonas sp. HGC4]|uniref:hypothetical protein n=1 Tax=Dysgonomonas sp. HGC4 TaxID=1658009 RepID=UPI000683387A|nr:hypothetical protein [Dysgonomonas sp. HGC4]MBD8347826.1 hypothetical protein [Dysgonomonas sp. HGC4]